MDKQKDIKGWINLIVCIAILLVSIISSGVILRNDLEHLALKVDDILTRVERIENTYFTKGESK